MVYVRDATSHDIESITALFNELIPTRTVTWSEQPDSVDQRLRWFEDQQDNGLPVLVAVDSDVVIGFAAYGPFRDNHRWPGYRYTVELSIHVGEQHWARGAGRALMTELVARARRDGVHVIVAAVDSENTESVAFHQKMGFKAVGRLEQTGWKFGRWLDLIFLQLTLD